MDGEGGSLGILLIMSLLGGWMFIQTSSMIGILLILLGVLVFFGGMASAGEDSDFSALHEW